jgi:hypothetical protein
MALASRSARRGGEGSRWLLVGVVITLFVLLIAASLKSRSPGPGQQLATGAWIDRVLPIVTTSTEEGQQLATIWSNGLRTPAPSLTTLLDQVATGASHAYQQVVVLHPPVTLDGAAGLLEACLLVRSEAATSLRNALGPVLTSGASGSAGAGSGSVTAIQTAGNDMQVGDQAYQLFTQSLPKLGLTMPASAWATNPAPYQPIAAAAFLASLQSAMSTTPVHEVKIYAVSTSPAAESSQGGTEVLPDSSTMSVTVVVGDVGNQAENDLTVTASIVPEGGSSSVRDFVDLVPGQAVTIEAMGPLTPPQGVTVTLTVTVAPQAGSATPPATQKLTFMMPAPPPTTTTTSLG